MTIPLGEIRAHREYIKHIIVRIKQPGQVVLDVETCDGNRFDISDDNGAPLVFSSLKEATENIWDLGRISVIEGTGAPVELRPAPENLVE